MEKIYTEAQLKAKYEAEMLRQNATKGRPGLQFLTELILITKAEEKEKEAKRIIKNENQD